MWRRPSPPRRDRAVRVVHRSGAGTPESEAPYRKDRGGDIDHIVLGPTGAFAIETESYRFMRRDAGQARGNAWWLKTKLEIPWVTAVLCVAGEPQPRHEDRVWVMGDADLVD